MKKRTALTLGLGLTLAVLCLLGSHSLPTSVDLDIAYAAAPEHMLGNRLEHVALNREASILDCGGDDWEPNDTINSATLINANVQYAAYVCPAGDDDYFKFWVVSGQEITVRLIDLPASFFDLALYDPNGSLRASHTGSTGWNREIEFVDPMTATGFWYARVFDQGDGWSEYAYYLKVTLGVPPPALELRKEALELPGSIASVGDTVRFQITLRNTGPTAITTLPLTDVFDDNCFSYLDADPTPDNVDEEQHRALWYNLGPLPAGASRIVTVDLEAHSVCEQAVNRAGVNGASDVNGTLLAALLAEARIAVVIPTATATPTPTATRSTGCPEIEPDNDFSSAQDLTLGTDYVDYICEPSDADFYEFYLTSGDTIQVELTDMEKDYALRLYEQEGGMAVESSDNFGNADERITFTASWDGMHYVEVYSGSGESSATLTYKLRVSRGAPTATPTATATVTPTATPLYPNCPDGFEPNNTFDYARELGTGGLWAYICAPSDVDYWRFHADKDATILVTLRDLPRDYRLTLYKPDRSLAMLDLTSGTVDKSISMVATDGGTWYVSVSGFDGAFDVMDSYHIDAQTSDCLPDHLESNNDAAHATSLDVLYAGHSDGELSICPAGDEDWFSTFFSEAGDRFSGQVILTSGSAIPQLCLVAGDGQTELACTQGASGNE